MRQMDSARTPFSVRPPIGGKRHNHHRGQTVSVSVNARFGCRTLAGPHQVRRQRRPIQTHRQAWFTHNSYAPIPNSWTQGCLVESSNGWNTERHTTPLNESTTTIPFACCCGTFQEPALSQLPCPRAIERTHRAFSIHVDARGVWSHFRRRMGMIQTMCVPTYPIN